jgi:hypothetical protein
MTGPLVWVVGRGGFLGSHLERLVAQEIPGADPWALAAPALAWNEPVRLRLELGEAARAFTGEARHRGAPWMVLWCATAGGVGTAPEALQRETDALRQLLGSPGPAPSLGSGPPGGIREVYQDHLSLFQRGRLPAPRA